jgi:hypothetical protein
LESLAAQLEGFNFVIKIQLSFNKMIETQVAQLASSCLNHNTGKLPKQPKVNLKETVNVVTTRIGKSMQEPPFPQDAGTRRKTVTARNTYSEDEVQEEADESIIPKEKLRKSNGLPRVPRYNHLTISGTEMEADGR